jgi:hypothetical protein|nr:MAG TPA: hypothetical protein [Caudoviricetes sp.]DAX43538.1 MAG TPA: hypothetical protein [Caudoviricetes sp.]
MALVYLRMLENDQIKNNFIINTNNIKSIFKFQGVNNSGFEVYLMSGTVFNFNQIYYQGNFIYVHTMDQLYSLLTKLDSGVIQDGSS